MITVTIHRREYAIFSGTHCCARWIDFDFAPIADADLLRRSEADLLHRSIPLRPVEVEVPHGARPVERSTADGPAPRLAFHKDPWGADAWRVYYLAVAGEEGFRMARKKEAPDQLGLFGPTATATATPVPGPYGVDRVPSRPATDPPPAVARELPEEAASQDPFVAMMAGRGDRIDRADRLEAAIRRALPWLDDEGGRKPMPLTAANILRAALAAGESREEAVA